jgi:predicted transcriptional regulator
VSKHLKVLREAGFVSCRTAAQQRVYRIEQGPFEELDEWLEPYRRLWTKHLDALERHLDSQRLDSQEER